MASRKRRSVTYGEDNSEPKVAAPTICSLPIEGVNPAFDPNKALLRRLFFLNEDRNKYVSVAFYPAQGYTAHVEFGATKTAPLILTEQHFTTLSEHLQGLIMALCADEYYRTGVHDNFSIASGGSYKTAAMHIGFSKHRKQLMFKLSELQYLNSIMHIITNQLARYNGAMMDVLTYSISATASNEYIEPQPHYSKHIQYPQLYEELKAFTL